MEWGGTFDLLKDPSITDAEKQDIVKYVYEAFIEGFKENLIAQDKLNQLDKRVKLTKCGLRFNAFEIAKIFGAGIGGASVGSMIPGVGTVIG
ncbi:hypothetical protein KKH82_05700 [Patescibacteria group bacterium]|nr:hypothetical protein [Patescibacteria group bacterium]